MTVNAQVSKSGNENAGVLMRKFTRRIQGIGLVRHMRKQRYFERPPSGAVKKKRALKRITKAKDLERLIKEGKVVQPAPRTRTPQSVRESR